VLLALAANGPAFVQVTTCATAEQLKPPPVPDTNPSPVGNVSLTVIVPVVAVLPTLVTATEYTPLIPTVKLPVWLFTIDRSITGAAFTVVKSDDELFPVLVSPVVETLAVLVTLGTAPAATLTVSVIVLLAVAANGPAFVQVTPCATAAFPTRLSFDLTNPSPVGNVSLTVMVPVVAVLPTFV